MDIFRLTAFILIKQYIHSLSWQAGSPIKRVRESDYLLILDCFKLFFHLHRRKRIVLYMLFMGLYNAEPFLVDSLYLSTAGLNRAANLKLW